MIFNAVIITDSNRKQFACDVLEKYKNEIAECFTINDLTQYITETDNSVFSTKGHQNNQMSNYDDLKYIMDYIESSNIETIIFILDNRVIKAISEAFKNIKKTAYMIPYYHKSCDDISLSELLVKTDVQKPRLKMVQLNITQHCNLNCKGCANYSNLVKAPQFNDFQRLTATLRQLKNFFWGIEKIKIMGGEPLLNKELPLYISTIRTIFPDSEIEIATNGILLPKLDESLFSCVKKNNARFVISLYPAEQEREEDIKAILDKAQVEYRIYKFKGSFMKYLSEKPFYSKEEGFQNCPAKECYCIEGEELAVCARPLYIKRLNERFDLSIDDTEGKINLFTTQMTAWEIEKWLKTPFNTCSYCAPKQFFKWERNITNQAEKSDWIIDPEAYGDLPNIN